jgi:hypothetical protein
VIPGNSVAALVSVAATAANKPQAASNSFAALTLFFVVQFTVPLQPLSSYTTWTVTLLAKAAGMVEKNSIASRRMLEERRQVELFPCSSMASQKLFSSSILSRWAIKECPVPTI